MDIARQTALDLLDTVLNKRLAFDESFARAVEPLSGQDRAFVRQLTATTLRRLGQVDDLIDRCLDKPLPPAMHAVRNILRLGATQLLFMNVPAHAAIDTAVTLLEDQRDKHATGFKGLVNAILRRLSREGVERRKNQDGARLNTPKWLWDSWAKVYGGQTARRIAEMHLREPSIDLILRPGEDPAVWAKTLNATLLPTGSLRLSGGGRVEEMPGYADGAWWVQDMAASLPVRLMGDVKGKTAIDLCAAPGGKTAQLASGGAVVTAVDRSQPRLRRLRENMRRLKLDVAVIVADGTGFKPTESADLVLLDAPCSATGTIRRHPDVPWLKQPRDVQSAAAAQKALLEAAPEMLRPGGLLVYCVCSLQPEEGVRQIDAFLQKNEEFRRDAITAEDVGGLVEMVTEQGDLRTLPTHLSEQGGMDGFFAARLRKSL